MMHYQISQNSPLNVVEEIESPITKTISSLQLTGCNWYYICKENLSGSFTLPEIRKQIRFMAFARAPAF